MAKIKLTAFMDNISGKVNGTVFSSNRGGNYVKSKGKITKFKPGSDLSDTVNLGGVPTVQNGSPQGAAMAILSGVSKAWSNLTGDQRIAFNNAVPYWKKTDVFGDLRTPSGAQLFSRLNATQQNMAQHRKTKVVPLAMITTPPATRIELLPVASAVFSFVMGDSSASPAVAPEMQLFAGCPNGLAKLTNKSGILVEMTRPLSAGISAVGNSDFRQIWLDNEALRVSDAHGIGYWFNNGTADGLLNTYLSRFGVDTDFATNPELVGSKVFVRLTPVSLTNGTKGQGQVFSCIISENVVI